MNYTCSPWNDLDRNGIVSSKHSAVKLTVWHNEVMVYCNKSTVFGDHLQHLEFDMYNWKMTYVHIMCVQQSHRLRVAAENTLHEELINHIELLLHTITLIFLYIQLHYRDF